MQTNEAVVDRGYGGLNPVLFGYENCSPLHCYLRTKRTCWLLHYVVSGFGTFEIGGQVYTVTPGQIFVIPPFVETFYQADEREPWSYIWIGFTADRDLPTPLPPVVDCPAAGVVFERMKACSRMKNGRNAYLCGCLWELFSLFMETGQPEDGAVEKALACMSYEYMTGITVGDIARRLNMDRSYFTKRFRQKMGVSPGKYLFTLRMERAADLMMRQGETPSRAAGAVGYGDLYTFSRMFKRHFGLSPREYLRAKKEEEGAKRQTNSEKRESPLPSKDF